MWTFNFYPLLSLSNTLATPIISEKSQLSSFVLSAFSTLSWFSFSFLLSATAVFLALLVPVFRNPIHSLLALIGVFMSVVFVYFAAGAEFLSLVFLIVYVGAVAILFLFVIMLLNVKFLTSSAAAPQQKFELYSFCAGVGLSLKIVLYNADGFFGQFALLTDNTLPMTALVENFIYYVNYGAADVMAFATLYSDHAALFLLITFVLLAAMLGAIVLATATLDESESAASEEH